MGVRRYAHWAYISPVASPDRLSDDSPHFLHTVEDAEVEEVTQQVGKRPVQDAIGKGKKVSKKADKGQRDIRAIRSIRRRGCRGDPCSLGKAIELLNKYEDLNNKAYVKISKVLQQKDDRVVFMGMPKHRRRTWIEDILNSKED
ncbi:hypothetical protein SO802_030181 [Lithocarpus litseifolius]|uniref:Uncharacterized protein n=1 Tax=Lithocarpus litseifolius TaxID=425828 RepID=A0AAW2BXS6_9ROSI